MSKRNYAKRTKSTSRKTYADYIAFREEALSKGIQLRTAMSKTEFEQYYNRIANAKKAGEIKSSPWQYIKSKQRLLSGKQAKTMAKALTEMNRRNGIDQKVKTADAYKLGLADIYVVGAFIQETKEEGLYGGRYE